jgi:hypothetical protein
MIKLTLLTVTLVSASLFVQAQITKGSILLGGGISFGSGKSESGSSESTSRSFGFSPAIGIAVKDNAVVGIRLSYSTSKSEQDNTGYLQKNTGFNAGVFYRRYIGLSKAFYLFGEGAAYYGTNENRNVSTPNNTTYVQKGKAVGVNLHPGVTYVVSRRFHLEAGLNNLVSLQYSSSKNENISSGQTSVSESSGIDFSTNLSTAAPLTVGFRVVLGK